MKLILKQDVPNLGEAGEVVQVKAGFGRNYLLPQGLAYAASEANMKLLEKEQARNQERARRDFLEARRRAAQVEALSLTFDVLAGEDGRLFGSVTSTEIVDRANTSGLDFELDRRTLQLEEPLKELGVFAVGVRLHPEVEVELEVRVEREAD
ncbi:MAG: 50S ribosomal protein L9 [Gemmatimonadota bacterium]